MPTTREGLERSVSFQIVRSEGDPTADDGLTLMGYAAVFDQETEIDSWEGNFIETLAKGAFRKTIRERTPVLQFDHGRHPLIGSIPIGVIESLSEDDEGLYVEARLTDNWLIEPVRDAIRDKAVNGMSFRFEVIREEWRDNTGKIVRDDELMQLLWNPGDRGPLKRTLKEVRMHELGPVVFPAYAGTSVDVRAKQAAQEIYRDKDLMQSIRSSLALGWRNYSPDGIDLQREVAKVLLFRNEPIEDNHSSTEEVPSEVIEPPSVEGTQEEVKEDAPLNDEHSSKPEVSRLDPARIRRDAEYRNEYMQLILRGNKHAGEAQGS